MNLEKENNRQAYPLAPSGAYARSDMESYMNDDEEELKRKKRMKYLLYFVLFVVFQTIVITVFALTVMKVKGPKFRVRSATFETFDVGSAANPSFNIRMDAELGVKNTNWGPYKFQNSTIFFFYRGVQVGEAVIPRRKANMKSTKKFDIEVNLSSSGVTENSLLADDINSGILPLNSQSSLNGKVTLMLIMKKKKSSNMNCTMDVNISTRQLQNVKCK